jgi:hypothetical protein
MDNEEDSARSDAAYNFAEFLSFPNFLVIYFILGCLRQREASKLEWAHVTVETVDFLD